MLSNKLANILALFDVITKLPTLANLRDCDKVWADYELVMVGIGAVPDPRWYWMGHLTVSNPSQGLSNTDGMSVLVWQYWLAYTTAINHAPALEARVPYKLIRAQAERDLNRAFQRHTGEFNLLGILRDYVSWSQEHRFMSRDFIRMFNGMYRMINKEHTFNHPDFRNTPDGAFSFSAEFIKQYYHNRLESNETEALARTIESVGLASVAHPINRGDNVGRALLVLRKLIELGAPSCSSVYSVYQDYCQVYGLVIMDDTAFTREYMSLTLRQLVSMHIAPLELPFWLAVTLYDGHIYLQPEQDLDITLNEATDALVTAFGRSDGVGRRHTMFVLKALITHMAN